jgi:hypothetical protein
MFGSFSIGGKDTLQRDVHGKVLRYFQSVFMFLMGFLALALSGRRLFPEDLFSTARFFDQLTIAKVFDSPAYLADDRLLSFLMNTLMTFDFQNVTVSAITVALALAVTQIIVGYLLVVNQQPYTSKSKNGWILMYNLIRGRDSLQKNGSVNWYKIGYASLYIFCVIADTLTDVLFRASIEGGAVSITTVYMQSIFVSILVYGLLSEWLMMQGIAIVINHGYGVIVGTIPTFVFMASEITKSISEHAGWLKPDNVKGNSVKRDVPRSKNNNGRDPRKGRDTRSGSDARRGNPRSAPYSVNEMPFSDRQRNRREEVRR